MLLIGYTRSEESEVTSQFRGGKDYNNSIKYLTLMSAARQVLSSVLCPRECSLDLLLVKVKGGKSEVVANVNRWRGEREIYLD